MEYFYPRDRLGPEVGQYSGKKCLKLFDWPLKLQNIDIFLYYADHSRTKKETL